MSTTPVPITADPHPLLRFGALRTEFPVILGRTPSPDWLVDLLRADAAAPLERDEDVRTAVRDMLRHGGYKPTGRGKPASEYLARAAEAGVLAPINLAVDACNAVSLHSGLPISVVDADLVRPPLHIRVAPAGASYAFNASGQQIDLEGLLCLFDEDGPCANAVRDSQRTKTHGDSRRTLSIVWGCSGQEERLARTLDWYHRILHRAGGAPGSAPAAAPG